MLICKTKKTLLLYLITCHYTSAGQKRIGYTFLKKYVQKNNKVHNQKEHIEKGGCLQKKPFNRDLAYFILEVGIFCFMINNAKI